jgi:protein phosphatase
MNEELMIRLAARCEAAGRPNNEDNYQICEDLAGNSWGFTADKTFHLGEKGTLLVVCDGMGGMNAGEVASAIAVATIKKAFAPEFITERVMSSSAAIQQFIVNAIQAADAAIKEDGRLNPEHEGMGSTIVLVWMLGAKAYVGWCGDSRAYRFNPARGLERLSHDHSYVQELVDAGKLTEELAFDHPNNNIITRSLGDPRGKAEPDTKEYDLYNGDILLLCSDGLCGCLRDPEIEALVAQQQQSMQECRDSLWAADEAAGWHDNVTIVLAQVLSGAAVWAPAAAPHRTADPQAQPAAAVHSEAAALQRKNRNLKIALVGVFVILLLGAGFVGYNMWKHHQSEQEGGLSADSTIVSDTVQGEAVEAVKEAAKPATTKPAATVNRTEADAEAQEQTPEVKVETPAERQEDQDVQVVLATPDPSAPAQAAPAAPAQTAPTQTAPAAAENEEAAPAPAPTPDPVAPVDPVQTDTKEDSDKLPNP